MKIKKEYGYIPDGDYCANWIDNKQVGDVCPYLRCGSDFCCVFGLKPFVELTANTYALRKLTYCKDAEVKEPPVDISVN